MRTFLLSFYFLLLELISLPAFAIDYTFTGNGDWTLASNWAGGIVPPGLSAGNTITITGTALTMNCSACPNFGGMSGGTLTIAVGGSLTLQNAAQFSLSGGSIIVNGTMTNKAAFLEVYPGINIVVNGTFNNQKPIGNTGTVTVNNGGTFDNQLTGSYFAGPVPDAVVGFFILNSGGTLINRDNAVFRPGKFTNNGGTINNTSVFTGSVTITGNLTNAGTLAPGSSPGLYTVTGNYTATSTAVHVFEVAGTAASSYDRLVTSGIVNLDGALNVSLISGFTPSSNHDLTIIAGSISGTFATVTKPAKYSVVYNANSVILRYNTALPVTFTKVDAIKDRGAAKVVWNISSESSIDKYIIERSSDGKDFKSIGQVASAQLSQYNFVDKSPDNFCYYRIKALNQDGSYQYSQIITFQNGKAFVKLSMFPNPAKGEVIIQHATTTSSSKISIYAVDGRLIQIVYPEEGVQRTSIDLSFANSGIYVMLFEDGDKTERLKFIKQ